MAEYYAVERSPEYLAHYGVLGMKWGVRRAIKSGNSAKLSRQYTKAQKKLAKLEKRATKTGKYARRAALMGAGAAAAGGIAALGTSGVANVTRGAGKIGRNAMVGIGGAMSNLGNAAGRVASSGKMNPRLRALLGRSATALKTGGRAVDQAGRGLRRGTSHAAAQVANWGNNTSLSKAAGKAVGNVKLPTNVSAKLAQTTGYDMAKYGDKISRSGITNNTIARVGAGVIGAGLAAGAARNAYKAATAKRKAEKFRSAMNESFKGTKYANGGNRQGKKRRR